MVPRSDSPSPCRQQRSSSHGATPHVVGSDGSFIQPLAPASPPARGFSHTPPLPPAVSGGQCRSSLDPLGAFSVAASNLAAADGCLAAACSLLQFEIAEIWTYTGDYSAVEGKAVEPMLLHVYTKPATIESFGGKVQEELSGENKIVRHTLSPSLVDQARKEEGLLWYTSMHPDTPLQADVPFKTAVALPVSMHVFRRDLCFVFFAEDDVNRQDRAVSVLTQLSKAAGVAMSSEFPAHEREDNNHSRTQAPSLRSTESFSTSAQKPQEETPINVDVRWDQLTDVEFMVNGSRCTIYTAFYGSEPVVAKVMRKDVKDKDVVRQELELEMGLLMRLRHPNIVKLVGAGTHPEPFLLIERLDGGTLAQRCGNALNIRDRRRRFRHKRPFTYEELLRHGVQLAGALHYMHNDAMPGKLVVHRDLKPDNIGFDTAGNLKLIDLGLGRVVSKSTDDNATYRMTGETGSLRYMAPEVALGKPYNGAADVYGFAIILWEMATVTKPFEAMGRDEFFQQVVVGGTRPYLSKNWPPEFGALLAAGWHPDMRKRQNFKEIKTTLGSLLEAAAASAAQARSVQRPTSRKFGLFKASSKKGTKGTFA